MKKVLLFCILLFTFFQFKKANAQPTRIWASYYGDYTQYTPTYNLNAVQGTVVYQIISDKKDSCVYIFGTTTDSSGVATLGSFKDHYTAPYTGANQATNYGRSIFLAKFNTSGDRVWATYYGGNWESAFGGAALDSDGNIYITGATYSGSGIATMGSYKSTYTGHFNANNPSQSTRLAFLVKFNNGGQRVWGTYYGQYSTAATSIAYDSFTNSIYIAGGTSDSSGIATPGSFKDSFHPSSTNSGDAFIAKFDTSGNLSRATYCGGEQYDGIGGLWTGNDGSVYAYGYTTSDSGIATPGADVGPSSAHGPGFLVKFNNNGQLLWGTYIGHGVIDPFAITGHTNADGEVVYISAYIPGEDSLDITSNAYQPTFGGGAVDIGFLKYGSNGIRQWTTYFGGNNNEPNLNAPIPGTGSGPKLGPHSIFADEEGNIYMVSTTNSTQGIQHACQPLPTIHQRSIIAKWNPDGNLIWSSYADADLDAVCAGNGGNFYIGGYTTYDSLATSVSHQPTKVTNRPSGFFAKLSSECPYISIPVSQNQNQLSVGDSFDTYQWYQNGNVLSGADSNVYSVPAGDSGSYYVAVTKSCGCSYHSDTVNYQSTGIEKVAEGPCNLQLFPNPATGKVTFRFDLKQPETVFVSIYDLVGRQLLKKVYGTLSGQQEKKLDVSNLQPGLYFVKFAIGNRQVIRKLEVE